MKPIPNYVLAGFTLLVFALLSSACTGDRPAPEESEMTQMEGEQAMQPPGAFVYIQHDVRDFDAWLVAYDAFDEEREAANVAEIWVYRDVDQPNRVHVLHGAADVGTLRSFTQMEELASAMQNAGVVGEPRFDFMNIVEETRPDSLIASQYNVLVAHEVADWGPWKAAFDAHRDARMAAGLTSRGVARGADNPNMVYINFAVGDLEAARAFAASEDLKNVMEGAGVVGAPEIYFAETVRPM